MASLYNCNQKSNVPAHTAIFTIALTIVTSNKAFAQQADTVHHYQINAQYIKYHEQAAFRFQRAARDLTVSLSSAVVGSISSVLLLRYGADSYRNKAAIATGTVFGSITVGFGAGTIYNLNMGGKNLKQAAEELKKY